MIPRILYGLFIILCAFLAPWWISVVFSFLGLFYFKNLYEVIAVGIIIDSLYGSNLEILNFSFVFTLFFIVSFYVVLRLRKNLLI